MMRINMENGYLLSSDMAWRHNPAGRRTILGPLLWLLAALCQSNNARRLSP